MVFRPSFLHSFFLSSPRSLLLALTVIVVLEESMRALEMASRGFPSVCQLFVAAVSFLLFQPLAVRVFFFFSFCPSLAVGD